MNQRTKFLKFQLERWIQRGIFHQLMFAAALILAISLIGGLLAWAVTDQFDDPLEAIWWSFLRLSDPGYLGDDEGVSLRIISTIVTVLGYVLFLGSLVAIMTQWLNQTLRRYESGLTPISMSGHIVIIGRTNRTPELAKQLLSSGGGMQRFLEEHDTRRLRIVIVSDEVDAEKRSRLRSLIGKPWRNGQVFLRAGSALKLTDLARFELPRASSIIIPGDEFTFGNSETSDTRAVKTLLNLRQILEPLPMAAWPTIVVEVLDPRHARAAQGVLQERSEIVMGNAVIARLVAQSIRDHRLAIVFLELLAQHQGCAPYVRQFPELEGHHPVAANSRFDRAIVIGAVRIENGRPVTYLNPPREFRLERDDLLVLISRAFEDCVISGNAEVPVPSAYSSRTDAPTRSVRRVLVLGWSYKIGIILQELSSSKLANIEVTIASRTTQADRERFLGQFETDPDRVRVKHIETDYTVSALRADTDADMDLESFDTIVLLASTWLGSAEAADARVIMGYEFVKSMLAQQIRTGEKQPKIVLEFANATSSHHYADSSDVKLVSPEILGYLQAHVAIRPVLNSVFGELFAPGGAEVAMRLPEEYGLTDDTLSFRVIEAQARNCGEIALGLLTAAGTDDEKLELCPNRDSEVSITGADVIVVLAAAHADD